MPSVLLWLTRLDALRNDAEVDPPDGQGVRPPAPVEAKGGPLSLRMADGRPNSRNADSKMGLTEASSGDSTISQRSRYRL